MKKLQSNASYSELSDEYYEIKIHPTCNNFRVGSKNLINAFFKKKAFSDSDIVVEIGAGKSVVAEILLENNCSIRNLNITDSYQSMLNHSTIYREKGSRLNMLNAEEIHTKFSNVDCIIGSLGDPYNTRAFWESAYKALKRGGHCIFTTPSYDWANQFRVESQESNLTQAYFVLRDGREIGVPSYIYNKENQIDLIYSVGFEFIEAINFYLSSIATGIISHKLISISQQGCPIVVGYFLKKN